MPWTYSIADDNSKLTITNHTGTVVGTVTNDGNGLTIPDDVFDVMLSEFNAALDSGDIDRALRIMRDASFEQIEEQPK